MDVLSYLKEYAGDAGILTKGNLITLCYIDIFVYAVQNILCHRKSLCIFCFEYAFSDITAQITVGLYCHFLNGFCDFFYT